MNKCRCFIYFCMIFGLLLVGNISFATSSCKHTTATRKTVVAATCTHTGTFKIVCNSCGTTIKKGIIDRKNHSYKAATCTKPKICSGCGATYGSKLGHNFSRATCTQAAKCSRCGVTSGSKLGHKYNDIITRAATCTEKGIVYHDCKNCTYGYAEAINAKGHQKSAWQITKTEHYKFCLNCKSEFEREKHDFNSNGKCGCGYTKPVIEEKVCNHEFENRTVKASTCIEDGIKEMICQNCDYKKTESIKALGHTASTKWSYNNNNHYKKCLRCDYKFNLASHSYSMNGKCECGYAKIVAEEKVCNHEFESRTVKASTCIEDGVKEMICQNCDYKKTESIKALGHTASTKWSYNNNNHYKKCLRCDYILNRATHKYDSSGKCVCGAIKSVDLNNDDNTEQCMHLDTAILDETKSTCKQKGIRKIKCNDCNKIFTETLELDDHSYGKTYIVQGNGHVRTCEVCYKVSAVEKHRFSEGKCTKCNLKNLCNHLDVREATCTIAGKCNDCGEIFKALGHNYSEEYEYDEKQHYKKCINCDHIYSRGAHKIQNYETIKSASCLEEGQKKGFCDICKKEIIKKIDKSEHVFSKEAGYSFDGNGHYTHCIYCDCINPKSEKHNPKEGPCTICGWFCNNHQYFFDKINKCFKCTICGFVYSNVAEECEHNIVMKTDQYGHYSVCSLCGYKDMYNRKGKIDNTKYGAHNYREAVDLCNGKHSRKCKNCDYEFISVHVYFNGVCIACGSQNITGIQNVNSTKHIYSDPFELQRQLKEVLKYDIGSSGIDGDIGKNTINAINKLLLDQGSTRQIKEESDITDDIYSLIMNCTETSQDADIRKILPKVEDGTATQKDMIKICQLKLQELGYYSGLINSSANEETKKAFNEFLRLNGLDDSQYDIKNLPESIFETLLYCEESFTKAKVRELESARKEWKKLMDVETSLLNEEEREIFDKVVMIALGSETEYNMEGSRDVGPKKFLEKLKYGNYEDAIIEGTLKFDCSSFASTVMNLVYGIECKRSSGASYATHDFKRDKENFEHRNCTKTGVDIENLQKGELILCIDKDGENHIMVYCGNGMIVHSNGTHNGVSMDKLSPDDDYTDMFLSTKVGVYNEIYVLTPKK